MSFCKKIAIFVFVFIMSSLTLFISGSVAQEIDDPILEYSYHIKIDLSVIKDLIEQAFDPTGFTKTQAKKLTDIRDKLINSGVGDLKDVTADFKFTDDQTVGMLDVRFLDSISSKGSFSDFIKSPPRSSVIRTAIPEDKTLAWLTIMDPALIMKIMQECAKNCATGDGGCCADMQGMCDMVSGIGNFMGNEMNLIISDVEISLMGEPDFHAALILKMPDGISGDDLKKLSGIMDNMLVEKLGAKKAMSKWQSMDVVTYSETGCPMDIQPSFIADKYWFIIATDPETLESMAEYVLNPKRTAQSKIKPPVMNGMLTINMNRLFEVIPDEAFDAMNMVFQKDPHKGNLSQMIKDEDWGIIRLERTHANNGVKVNFTANREIYSLIYHTSIQGMIFGLRQEMKNEFKSKEAQVSSNIHTLQMAIERYGIDNGEYPADLEKLKSGDIIHTFPSNSFTYAPMSDCGFPGTEGDYHYIPIMDEATDKITAYWLIGYGSLENEEDKLNNDSLEKEDVVIQEPDGKVDNVVIVLEGKSYD
ncbi:hypothetical protein KKB99_05170 [bacterium]|nr:hypothetical protein [bacterium]MBU1025387.1 hypothetical protein [bacterium]